MKNIRKIYLNSENVNTFSYKQVFEFYRENWYQYPTKYFHQDGTKIHSSKLSKKNIISLFWERFIPTWGKGPKFNGQFLLRWPSNSPALSGIEIMRPIIKQIFILFPPKDLDTLKSTIILILESIPKTIFENITKHIKHRWEICI